MSTQPHKLLSSAPAAASPRTQPEKPPVPEAETTAPATDTHPDPTRYGDWELRGKCIDF